MSSDWPPPVLFYSENYNTDLSEFGINKPFALDRGRRVLDKLAEDYGEQINFTEPLPITDEDALLVHTPRYLDSLQDPKTWQAIMEFKDDEFDPSAAVRPLNDLIDDIKLKCGGTKAAVELALA